MNKEYFDTIFEKLTVGDLALFIGAGMSTLSGLPDGWTLTKNIKSKFPKINQDLNDFMDVCDDVVDTPPYNRQELIDFLKGQLTTFTPSKYHISLTKYDWSTIFTTNFDNIIEVSYNISTEKIKMCNPVIVNAPSVNLNDRKKVNLFKIMGCINASTEDGEMVLSKSDFNLAIQKRNHYLKLLSDIVKSGTILYVGYSFKDKIATQIIKDLIQIHGVEKMPWSYWISKDKIQTDEKTTYFFNRHKIIPIESTIENFFDFLEGKTSTTSPRLTIKQIHSKLNIRGKIIDLEEDLENLVSSYFDILNEKKLKQEPTKKEEFLMGTDLSWAGFNAK